MDLLLSSQPVHIRHSLDTPHANELGHASLPVLPLYPPLNDACSQQCRVMVRGVKICPKCSTKTGSAAKQCVCGHNFHAARLSNIRSSQVCVYILS